MHLPWQHCKAVRMTSHLEESIMKGTRATSGSLERRLTKWRISSTVSRSPSSRLMSITRAPSSTCRRAMLTASSYFFSLMSRRKRREPATLQRSPTFMKRISGVSVSCSRPVSCSSPVRGFGRWRGAVLSAMSLGRRAMWASVVPQHPPTMFTRLSAKNGRSCSSISSGVWSYCPSPFGSPAFG